MIFRQDHPQQVGVPDFRNGSKSEHCLATVECPLSCKICLVRRAEPLISDVDLFGNCKRIIHFNAEVASRALDPPVTKKKLDGS
jgi:hypothetical protein